MSEEPREERRSISIPEQKTTPCKWCKKPTPMLGTQLCNGCYELDTRIYMDLTLAEKIVAHYKKTSVALTDDARLFVGRVEEE